MVNLPLLKISKLKLILKTFSKTLPRRRLTQTSHRSRREGPLKDRVQRARHGFRHGLPPGHGQASPSAWNTGNHMKLVS